HGLGAAAGHGGGGGPGRRGVDRRRRPAGRRGHRPAPRPQRRPRLPGPPGPGAGPPGPRGSGLTVAVYVVAHIAVEDPDAYADYQRQGLPTIAPAGGRVIAGGGPVHLEGEEMPGGSAI